MTETPVDHVAQEVKKWDDRAVQRDTPCGAGVMRWRSWGSGPPVVLLHGNSGSWTHWIRNLEALSRSHTIYVPDLPGHGDSAEPALPPTMLGFAELLWQGLDLLLPDHDKVDLVGFSLGSVLAECMAVQRPSRTRSVVLLRGSFSPGPISVPENVIRWRGVEDPAEMARIQRHNLAVLMFHDPARIDDLAVHTHTRNLLRTTLDMRPLLASRPVRAFTDLNCVIHGVSGEFDIYGGSDVAAQGRALLAAHPEARFHLIPDAGHWAIYEAADEVNAVIANALA